MKRSLSLLWTVLLISMLVLSACGNSSTEPAGTSGDSNGQSGGSDSKGEASDFPNKEITLIVSNSAGGSNDQAARSIVPYLEDELGVPVVVKNIDGAGGNVARAQMFDEKPDGYTIMETPMPSMGIGELIADGDFKTTELTPVFNLYGQSSNVIIVPNDSPIKTIDDLIQASKEKQLTASGSGTATNAVLGSIFLKNIGVKHEYVPFGGGTAAAQQVAGGHVDFGTSSETAALPLVKAGKIRAIASSGVERSTLYPDAPTLAELGYSDAKFSIIYGFYAPPETPKAIVDTLANAFKKASQNEEFLKNVEKIPFTLETMMSEEFDKAVEESYQLVKDLKEAFNVK